MSSSSMSRATYLDDEGRLAALAASGLLSVDVDAALDRWTRLARGLLGARMALLSLVTGERQFFKSHAGLPPAVAALRETPLSHSFCQHVVTSQAPLVVSDAREHPLVRDNGAVEDLDVIAYAGQPVTTSDGHTLGAFCVIDSERRDWTPDELELLEDLAAGLIAEIELRASLRAGQALQADLTRMACVDELTGLPNRRQLTADLRAAMAAGHPRVLAVFDLDGFKAYNDAFGHPAGDSLLARLADNLATVASEHTSTAYRLGGDEFCLLCDDEDVVAAAALALQERGDGFSIGSSYGAVQLSTCAGSAERAMVVSDQRLYATKHGRSGAARQQVHDVLMRVLREREPDLDAHVREVAVLSRRVGEALGLRGTALDEVSIAAQMHDIGKVAIPDTILGKPGPLDEAEWAIMKQHTVLGERILAAAPALGSIATIVRSSHERWDGRGYPDGLAGEAIPLGSRIVCACDAFHAMTSDRPYAARRSVEEALEELRAHAGRQFDRDVVEALEREAGGLGATPPGYAAVHG